MKVRWLIPIKGTVEGRAGGVSPGDVMELPDERAKRYLGMGYVTTHLDGELLQPFLIGTAMPPNVRDERFAKNTR